MTRLEKVLADLKANGKKGLFIYMTAGLPSGEKTASLIKEIERAGANVIELGLPFSDPLADGPVIQTASVVALKNGMTLKKALDIVKEVRTFSEIPVIGMGYVNNLLHYGFEKFVGDAKTAGLDGIILPDVPHEESADMREICAAKNFHLAEFITPGTTEKRMKETCEDADGFIYCVSNYGVTGVKDVNYGEISGIIKKARGYTKVPLAVGFGIGTPQAAVQAAKEADAVIVGSAVVKKILDGKTDEALTLIADMRRALDEACGR